MRSGIVRAKFSTGQSGASLTLLTNITALPQWYLWACVRRVWRVRVVFKGTCWHTVYTRTQRESRSLHPVHLKVLRKCFDWLYFNVKTTSTPLIFIQSYIYWPSGGFLSLWKQLCNVLFGRSLKQKGVGGFWSLTHTRNRQVNISQPLLLLFWQLFF